MAEVWHNGEAITGNSECAAASAKEVAILGQTEPGRASKANLR